MLKEDLEINKLHLFDAIKLNSWSNWVYYGKASSGSETVFFKKKKPIFYAKYMHGIYGPKFMVQMYGLLKIKLTFLYTLTWDLLSNHFCC